MKYLFFLAVPIVAVIGLNLAPMPLLWYRQWQWRRQNPEEFYRRKNVAMLLDNPKGTF